MRAVILAGDGSVTVEDRPVPEPGPGDVRVRVHGAGLNRADLLQQAGLYAAPPGSPSDIPGLEFAGTVDPRGDGVSTPALGARVAGITGGGAQAEFVCVPAEHSATVPDGLDLVAFGGVPEAFVTAYDAMVTQAALSAGEWLSIHAVGSGVGTAGLQLAHAMGARVVGTARSADKLERCRALGLDAAIVPPTDADGRLDVGALAAALRAATVSGVDVCLQLVGGTYVNADIAAAAQRGRIILVGTLAGGNASLPILTVMSNRLTIRGTVLRARDRAEKAAVTASIPPRDVVPFFADGAIAPVVDATLPINDAPRAYETLASDTTFGKLILDPRG